MSKDREFQIELDGDEIFYAGQKVSGRVRFRTAEPYNARAVFIKFDGKARTDWSSFRFNTYTDSKGEVHPTSDGDSYSATVVYADFKNMVWSSTDGENMLPAGSYCWPFSFELPSYCPPSFEGKHGSIRYFLTAEVDRPWWFNHSKKQKITVFPHLDLNQIAGSLQPLNAYEIENVGICCFKKGFVEMKVDISQSGFVSEEIIPIRVHVSNRGTVPVKKISAKLIQTCKYIAFRYSKTIKYTGLSMNLLSSSSESRQSQCTVAEHVQNLDIQPGSNQYLELALQLPPMIPSLSENSPTISVDYTLEVMINTNAIFYSSVKCAFPLLIGTQPIEFPLHIDPPSYDESVHLCKIEPTQSLL